MLSLRYICNHFIWCFQTSHTRDHISLFYTVPPEDREKLFNYGGLPKGFKRNCITFAETSVMVREPAIEIIEYLKKTDFSRPAVRYILCILLLIYSYKSLLLIV